MSKKIICLLLCTVMVFGLGVSAFAAQPSYETITGEYSYCPSLGFLDFVSNQTSTFTYSDEYFTHSGYDYNHNLAIMSMVLTQTAFASATSSVNGWDTANENFNDLVSKCGFKNISCNQDAISHPGGETIGAYAASKPVVENGQKYTLIAVGVRGHNYGGEWYSNFDVGVSGEHAGFADARDKVLSFMKDYVAKYKITGPVKVWVTGYSRGAITANMVGGALDNGFKLGSKVSLQPKDLYCYTFEAPQGVYDANAHSDLYANIHNILNHNDFVPLVSFSEWDQTRYGVDYYLPCRQYDSIYAELKPTVEAQLSQMGWMNILGLTLDTIDDFHYISLNPVTAAQKKNVTQIEFYPEAIDALFDSLAPTREYFVQYLQDDVQEVSLTLLGVDTNRLLNAIAIFGQKFTSMDGISELLASATVPLIVSEGNIADVIVDLFMESMQEAQCANYNGDQVRAALKNLVPKLLVMVKDHPDTVMTLLGNIVQIINAHFPEIGLTWLRVTPAEFFEAQNNYSGNSNGFFKDVAEGSYCYDAVKWAADNGIANGYTAATFAPDDACTRAQVVTFLWRAAGCPQPESNKCSFKDVSASSPYYTAILWACEEGIALGYNETHFAPNETVTRAQFVTFLWRYEGQPKASGRCPFVDVASDSPYYTAIVWAAKNDITRGIDNSHFAPNSPCTRGQVVTLIYRDMA